jgi:hypothetical protein
VSASTHNRELHQGAINCTKTFRTKKCVGCFILKWK